jgi:nucleotide-binding universal stress UspA family protein
LKHILVAVDGSDASLRAADLAARLAKDGGAELIALLVIPVPPFKVPGELADYYDDARKSAKVWMSEVEVIAMRHDKSLKTEIIVGASTPLDGILGYAEDISADLIVSGRRGSASSRRRIIGSVSSGLVEFADCPVLVVK